MLKSKKTAMLIVSTLIFCLLAIGTVSAAETPTANFTSNVTNGSTPLSVQFIDTSTNNPTLWAWDFNDDGNIDSSSQNPTYTYNTPGNYTITLTASTETGSSNLTKTNYIIATAQETSPTSPLPDYNNIFIQVANNEGVKYNAFGNNTYNIRFEGYDRGLNALHISTDPSQNFGQVTQSINETGIFYVTDSGGKGYEDNIILLIAVNGTISDNFRLLITVDGYTWTPNPVSNQAPTSYTYQPVSLNETFTKADFIYGPQIWKPTGNGFTYPLYENQDTSNTANTFQLMFIDLYAGVLRPNAALQNQGAVRITYSFENLDSFATFNAYGYCKNTNNGNEMIAWTNSLLPGKAPSGYSVTHVTPLTANFTTNTTNGVAPMNIQFTDTSTGTPTSWAWDFTGDGTIDSTLQNPTYTYNTPGTYTVTLTTGNNTLTQTNYITVNYPAPVANFTVNSTNGLNPLTVQFTDSSTGNITSWYWDFGDGTNSTDQNPVHIYTNQGNYTVTLTVTGPGGNNTLTQTDYITALNSNPPVVTATPDEGIFNSTQTVTLTSDQTESTIYYTTDGSDPTDTSNTNRIPYTNPIPIANTTTLNFAAVNTGGVWSTKSSKTYVIDTSTPTVTASPEGGLFNSTQNVILNGTDADTNTTVYYTTDNTDPQNSSTRTVYTTPIIINTTTILRYIAVDQASNWSPEYTQTYTIDLPPIVTNSLNGGTYSTTQTVALTSDDPTAAIYYANDTTDPRTSGTRIQYTGPITISNTTTLRYAAVDPAGNWSPLYLTNYVIGTGGLSDSAWPKFYGNIENTCLSNYTGPQTNTTLWTYNTGSSVSYVTPVIGTDGTVYFGSGNGKILFAFNPDGTLKWTFTVLGGVYTPAIGPDGTIYFGTGSADKKIYALNPDGTLQWNYTTGGICRGITIGADGTIYAGCSDVNLYALNSNGTLKWKYAIAGAINYCPTIGPDGTIYIGGMNDNHFYAINPDGTLKWSYNGCRWGGSASIASDGTIYVSNIINPNIAVFAFNPNGTLKWISTSVGYGFSYATPAIGSDGTIYIGSNDQKIYAFYPTNGTVKWSYATGNSVQCSPVIGADGTIYFGVYEKAIYAFRPDGSLKWAYYPGTRFYCSPSIAADGTLYIADNNGKLYAFKDVAPEANFTTNTTNGTSPLTVQFTDTSTHTPTSWLWDFGDETTSTDKNPTHTYTTDGTYTVTLTATNSIGNNTLTKTDLIKVGNPELVASNLETPGNPVNGTAYIINTTLTNTGVSDAGAFVVKFYDNNVQVGKISLSGLATGASTILNFNWTPNTVGSHILSVIADVNKQINETNRSNSQITQNVTVIASNLPELTVSNLQLPENPVNGTSYLVNVTVANTGLGDAGSFVVKLYDNNVQIAKTTINGLKAGENTILNFNWTPNTIGTHVLSVIADANKQINETNRDNNQITQTVTTTASTLPDLTVSNLELPANPVVGTTYTINVTVANTGASDITSSFAVKFYDNNTQIQKITVSSLAAGANTILTFNWTPTTNGTHNLSVIADANKQLIEVTENNNQITQTITTT